MSVGTEEDTEVDVMVIAVVMTVVDKEDLVEGGIVLTHMNSPAGTENLLQRPVYTLQSNI